jgi:DNA-directed RNA polymerase subunit F
MKNIEAILKDLGIEVPEDKKADLNKAVNENYKTIADWQKQKDKVEDLTGQLQEAKDGLKKFEGVDAAGLQEQITKLNKQLEDKDAEYQAKIADRDFSDLLGETITKYKGINPKAIKALLDVEALKASKNQKADVDKAVADLTTAEDSKMLFGETSPVGKANPIGKVGGGSGSTDLSKMRAIMGLPTEDK